LVPHVLATLRALKAAKTIRKDIVVAANERLAGVALGDGTHSLAGVLLGNAYKDEWRFMMSLDQASPWAAYPKSWELEEVTFNGQSAVGMLWAKQNESTVFSFAFPPNWGNSHIEAQFNKMDGDANFSSVGVRIPNLSKAEHVTSHSVLINNYGGTVSSSALVYEGADFAIRMYFNDHPPPHFHVLARTNTSETLATCAIETLDVLAGDLSSDLRRRVKDWAVAQKADLITNWERCRTGKHPFLLDH